jgi:DNA adenine methylase
LLADVLPTTFHTYWEPFLGSGALFFLLKPRRAVLSDKCLPLVETFRALRDNPRAVERYLRPLKPRKRLFYHVRKHQAEGRFKRAAEFIFLNKSCWNGLYRVNSEGIFNVPFGRPRTDNLADPANLWACSRLLRRRSISIIPADFAHIEARVRPKDLVYFDPPYVTGHANNGFVDYNEILFSWEDQIRLARLAHRLRALGAHVLVTNANQPAIVSLYPGFKRRLLERTSTLANDITKRKPVTEVILFS